MNFSKKQEGMSFRGLCEVSNPKELHENHNELTFLVERMKIGKEEKLVPNLKNKKRYVHIKALVKH